MNKIYTDKIPKSAAPHRWEIDGIIPVERELHQGREQAELTPAPTGASLRQPGEMGAPFPLNQPSREQDPLLHGPKGVFGGGSLERQVSLLFDERFFETNRQFMAEQIMNTQGNLHLAQVMELGRAAQAAREGAAEENAAPSVMQQFMEAGFASSLSTTLKASLTAPEPKTGNSESQANETAEQPEQSSEGEMAAGESASLLHLPDETQRFDRPAGQFGNLAAEAEQPGSETSFAREAEVKQWNAVEQAEESKTELADSLESRLTERSLALTGARERIETEPLAALSNSLSAASEAAVSGEIQLPLGLPTLPQLKETPERPAAEEIRQEIKDELNPVQKVSEAAADNFESLAARTGAVEVAPAAEILTRAGFEAPDGAVGDMSSQPTLEAAQYSQEKTERKPPAEQRPNQAGPRPQLNRTRGYRSVELGQQRAAGDAQVNAQTAETEAVLRADYGQKAIYPALEAQQVELEESANLKVNETLAAISEAIEQETGDKEAAAEKDRAAEAVKEATQISLTARERSLAAQKQQLAKEGQALSLKQLKLEQEEKQAARRSAERQGEQARQEQARQALNKGQSVLANKESALREARSLSSEQAAQEAGDWQAENRQAAAVSSRRREEERKIKQSQQVNQIRSQSETNSLARSQAQQRQTLQRAKTEAEQAQQWQTETRKIKREAEKTQAAINGQELPAIPQAAGKNASAARSDSAQNRARADQAAFAKASAQAAAKQSRRQETLAAKQAAQERESQALSDEESRQAREKASAGEGESASPPPSAQNQSPGPATPDASAPASSSPEQSAAAAESRPSTSAFSPQPSPFEEAKPESAETPAAGPPTAAPDAPPPENDPDEIPLNLRQAYNQAKTQLLSQEQTLPDESQLNAQQSRRQMEQSRLLQQSQDLRQGQASLIARSAGLEEQTDWLARDWDDYLTETEEPAKEESKGGGDGGLPPSAAEMAREQAIEAIMEAEDVSREEAEQIYKERQARIERQEYLAEQTGYEAGAVIAAAAAENAALLSQFSALAAGLQAETLAKIEQTLANAETEAQGILASAEDTAEKTLKAAEKAAEEVIKAAERKAANAEEGADTAGIMSAAQAEARSILNAANQEARQTIAQGQSNVDQLLRACEQEVAGLTGQSAEDQDALAQETADEAAALSEEAGAELEAIVEQGLNEISAENPADIADITAAVSSDYQTPDPAALAAPVIAEAEAVEQERLNALPESRFGEEPAVPEPTPLPPELDPLPPETIEPEPAISPAEPSARQTQYNALTAVRGSAEEMAHAQEAAEDIRKQQAQQAQYNALAAARGSAEEMIHAQEVTETWQERQEQQKQYNALAAVRGSAEEMAHAQEVAQDIQEQQELAPSFDPEMIAKQLRDAVKGAGTDESQIFNNLSNLTPSQIDEVFKSYSEEYSGRDLQTDLDWDLDQESMDRIQALRDGDKATANAIALEQAMSGIGTDEAAIMSLLRNKSATEINAIAQSYDDRYKDRWFGYNTFDEALKAELGGEDGHDYQRVQALLRGDVDTADAIAIDQAMHGGIFGAGTDEAAIEQIYEQRRTEVEQEAQGELMTTAQVEQAVTQSNQSLENAYNANTFIKQKSNNQTLRQSYTSEMAGTQLHIVEGLADNNRTQVDAARIQQAVDNPFGGAKTVESVLREQYERANIEVRRDAMVNFQMVSQAQGWTPEEASQVWTSVQSGLDQVVIEQAQRNMDNLSQTFDDQYGDRWASTPSYVNGVDVSDPSELLTQSTALEKAVDSEMDAVFSDHGQEMGRDLIAQGGRLSDIQELHYAIAGAGTDEAMLRNVYAGKTNEEIAQMNADYKDQYDGADLEADVMSELSGRDAFDIGLMMEGKPETMEETLDQLQRRIGYEKQGLGTFMAGEERAVMEATYAEAAEVYQQYQEAAAVDPNSAEAQELQGRFEQLMTHAEFDIQQHREQVDTLTDIAAGGAAVAVSLTVIACTGGLAAPASAYALAAVMGSMTAIDTKLLMKGQAYGLDEMAVDLASMPIDALAAYGTAGLGNQLLKGSLLKGLAQSDEVYSRMAAHFLANGLENLVQDQPAEFLRNLASEQVWDSDDPMAALLTNMAIQSALSLGVGGGIGSIQGVNYIDSFLSSVDELSPHQLDSMLANAGGLRGNQMSELLEKANEFSPEAISDLAAKVDGLTDEQLNNILDKVSATLSSETVVNLAAKGDDLSPEAISNLITQADALSIKQLDTVLAKMEDVTAHAQLLEVMNVSPEISNLLLSRPSIMVKLAKNEEAVDILSQVIDEVDTRGVDNILDAGTKEPWTTPLSPEQIRLSEEIKASTPSVKPTQPDFDLSQKDNQAYLENYVDSLYRQSSEATPQLNQMTEKIATLTGGTPGFRPGSKGRERVFDKISGYKGDASRLTDLAGSKIVYTSLDDLYSGLKMTREQLRDNIVQIKDRFITPQESGYRDILMNIGMENKHIAEFRLHLAQIDEISNTIDHDLYEVSRSFGPVVAEAKRELTDKEEAIKIVLKHHTQKLYENALKEAMRSD